MHRFSVAVGVLVGCIAIGVACTARAQARRGWMDSTVEGSPEPAKPYRIERVYPNLRFKNPVQLRPVPGRAQMLMLQVDGKLLRFDDREDVGEAELILDVGRGIPKIRAFGFGLHPDFETNGQLFLVYAIDAFGDEKSARLSRFVVSRSDGKIDSESEQILLTWPSGGHTGSTVEFDEQGLLYFSIGDGARPFPPDEFNVGQSLSDLRATICRIDINRTDGEMPYAIPDDNPFVETPGARPEIWAFGFRNPWRFSIDPPTGRLLCGDVGWEVWESVFDVKRAGNYGWSRFEGPGKLRSDVTPGPTPIRSPLVAYSHAVGQSITGGFIYRGTDLPELEGAYLYGDYVSGLIWGLRDEGGEVNWNPVLAQTGIRIITFAQSHRGETLVVSYEGGIHRLVRNPQASHQSPFPFTLSETGLFASLPDLGPSEGVYEYRPTAASAEGALAKRYHIAIPGDGTIQVGRQKRNWVYPKDTVFVRTYSEKVASGAPTKHLETQLLHFDGLTWQPYSYVWEPAQDEARLVGAGAHSIPMNLGTPSSDGSGTAQWAIPSRAQCRSCHTKQVGGAVGFSLESLSPDQLDQFVELGVINQLAAPGWKLESMVDPDDADADLELRAKSYLAANCAHCHCRGGGGSVALDLEFSKPIDQMGAIDEKPMQGGFGILDPRVIAPGDPEHSVLLYRISTDGIGRMPKLLSHDADAKSLLLIHDWIRSMDRGHTPRMDSPVSRQMHQLIELCREPDADRGIALARRASAEGDSVASGLFERFLPPNERRKTLGPDVDVQAILAMKGDADRGRQWLSGAGGTQCVACHRVAGVGRHVGPALDAIGSQRTREALLQSMIDPSANIDPKYQTVAVLTEDGKLVTGLLVSDEDGILVIRSADGKDHRLDVETLESRRTQTESLMPKGLVEAMTSQELADLLAYLESLKE